MHGDQTEESDIDILVEFSEPVGLLFIHLGDFLEEILGIKVDLLTPDAIKPNRKKFIMDELVYVYLKQKYPEASVVKKYY